MAFLDLFTSGVQKRNIGHFASIVRLAIADDVLTDGEKKLLNDMAVRLNISERKYKKILSNPDEYPIYPPVSQDNRIERLYNLTKMIFVDDEAVGKEGAIFLRVAVGLGFPTAKADKITEEAIRLAMSDTSLKDFTEAIKEIS